MPNPQSCRPSRPATSAMCAAAAGSHAAAAWSVNGPVCYAAEALRHGSAAC